MTGTPTAARPGRLARRRERHELAGEINALAGTAVAYAAQRADDLANVDPCHLDDAVNLAHYLALRRLRHA